MQRPSVFRSVVLAVVGVLYAVAAGIMFWPTRGLAAQVFAYCGQAPLDARPGWTGADATALLIACGPAGQEAYREMATYDIAFPLLTAGVLALFTLGARRPSGRGWLLLLPIALYLLADYAENVVIWILLVVGQRLTPAVALVGGSATTLKWSALALSVAVLIGVVVRAQVRRGRDR